MNRNLVCGAGGFIAGHLVSFLKEKGEWVRAVDIKPLSEWFNPNALLADETHILDLRHQETCEVATKNIDIVYQLAATIGGIGFITEVHAPIMRDNALININMLEAARKSNVKRFFFSSSACAYNHLKQESPHASALKESDAVPAFPDSMYGWEKLFTEFLAKSYHQDYGLSVRVARYHNVYGPLGAYKDGREKAPAAICRKVAEAHDGGPIVLWGDGCQTRTFLYVDDCLESTYALTQSDYTDPVNIGSDRLISVDDLARLVMRIAGKNLCIQHDLSKPQGVRGRSADLTLVKKLLGWQPRISYEQGLAITYRWIAERVKSDKTIGEVPFPLPRSE